ncbi:hypothetical protein EIK77_002370 [Talaromyces pinophilus]|nr:hypothetical protein EIK77_002370 [Talaromyces pinophilus]
MHAELSLQIDEDTGRPMILECRHERRPLEEISCRTCYGELLPSPKEFNDDEQAVNLPLLTKEELRAYRGDKLVHPEYSSDSCERLDFAASNTLYSYYNLSARTFLDLINDPVPNSQVAMPGKRFRLRFNSHKCTASDKKHVSIQLWPSDNNVGIRAKADERTIIYSMTNDDTEATVLVSFDPKIRFSYMHRKSVEILNEWVRIEPATRFQRVWDRRPIQNQ